MQDGNQCQTISFLAVTSVGTCMCLLYPCSWISQFLWLTFGWMQNGFFPHSFDILTDNYLFSANKNNNLFAMDYWQILHVVVPDVSKAESYQFLNIAKACLCPYAGRLVHAFSFHINACVLLQRDKTLKMTQGKTKRNVEIWRVQAMPCHNGHHWFNMYLKQMHAFLRHSQWFLRAHNKNLVVYRSRCRCVAVPFRGIISNASNAPPPLPPQNDAINVNRNTLFYRIEVIQSE